MPRGRPASQALAGLDDACRDRVQGNGDGRQIGRQCRHAHHGAARPRRALAVMAVPGVSIGRIRSMVHMRIALIVHAGVAMRHRHRCVVDIHHDDWRDLIGQARKRRPQRKRDGWREDAKQIGHDDGTPRPYPPRPRQSHQHRSDSLTLRPTRGPTANQPAANRLRVYTPIGYYSIRFEPRITDIVSYHDS